MRIVSLQGYRFIAALLVLFFHLGLLSSGFKGVDMFFVISGFIMYHSLLRETKPSLKQFIVHRISKIYLLYWFPLFILYLIRPYEINLAMVKAIVLVPGHKSIFRYSWSLSYELYFYLFIGLIAYFSPAYLIKKIIIIAFFLSSGIIGYHLLLQSIKGSIFNFLLGANIWQFILGLLAGHYSTRRLKIRKLPLLRMIASLAIIMFILIDLRYTDTVTKLIYGLLSALIISISYVIEHKTIIHDRISNLIDLLGNSSYAMYLFGPIVTIAFMSNGITNKFTIILFTILAAIAINTYFEIPLLKKLRALLLHKFAMNQIRN